MAWRAEQALLLASIAFLFWLSLKLGSMGGDQSALSSVAGTLERRGWITPSTANKASPSRMNADALAEKLKEKYGAEVVHAKRSVTLSLSLPLFDPFRTVRLTSVCCSGSLQLLASGTRTSTSSDRLRAPSSRRSSRTARSDSEVPTPAALSEQKRHPPSGSTSRWRDGAKKSGIGCGVWKGREQVRREANCLYGHFKPISSSFSRPSLHSSWC